MMKCLLSCRPLWGVVWIALALTGVLRVGGANAHSFSNARPSDEDPDAETRQAIIGGNVTNGQEFPFFVQAQDVACGGSLVALDVVLTAAHCAPYFKGSVLVGSSRLNSTSGPAQWRRIVGDIVVHPKYTPTRRAHDLAAFRIEPVTLANLRPVKLNGDAANPAVSQRVTVMGYGLTEKPEVQTQRLLKASLKVVDDDICQATYGLLEPIVNMNMTAMLCTSGASANFRGGCYGDSGGPLVDGNMTLVGVVSFGPNPPFCGVPMYPDVFARVSGHIDWIQTTTCQLSSYHANLSFPCPNLLCPFDATLLGYPSARLPSVANATKGRPGLVAVNVTQSPAAGTALRAGTTTVVTVSAQDASKPSGAVACSYTVKVPSRKVLQKLQFHLPKGATAILRNASLEWSDSYRAKLQAVSVKLSTKKQGPSAVVRVKIAYRGRMQDSVAFRSDSQGWFGLRAVNLSAPLAVKSFETWTAEVTSSGLAQATSVEVKLIGQKAYYW